MNSEYIDELTGLYNRKGLQDLIYDYANNNIVNVLFLDLDNFKTVNDLYGHAEGDRLLKSFAQLLNSMAKNAFPVRLGGDEFVVIYKGRLSRDTINSSIDFLYDKIQNMKAESIGFSVVGVSVGIVHNASLTPDNLSSLLHNADLALYNAKNNGKSCFVYFDDIATDLKNKEIIEQRAESAISNDLFDAKYQPIVHMQTSDVVSVDIRFFWQKEEGIDDFWEIREYREIFEKNGYIKRFEMYMFEKACREISKIKSNVNQKIKFNILLSKLTFLTPQIGKKLISIMKKYNIDFDDLELSIEETVFGTRNGNDLISVIHSLAQMGFSISLTRFGNNFESIKYLPYLDIKSLRFDGYYIDENYKDSKGGQIIRTLIRMGKELKFHVIGYGICSKEKNDFLNGCGCDSVADSDNNKSLNQEELLAFLTTHSSQGAKEHIFKLKNNFVSEDKIYEGIPNGQIEYVEGVCKEYGGVHFLGGNRATNVVRLPVEIMSYDSYTISMWVKPEKKQSFVSVFYARYSGGFMSLMPYLAEVSTSAFRIHEDINVDVWHDANCRSIEPNKWSYLTISYNFHNETMRYYINGRKAVTRRDVPSLFSCRDCIIGGDHFQDSFEGTISGLEIYNTAKSDEDIAKMYKSYLSLEGFCGENESFWMDF